MKLKLDLYKKDLHTTMLRIEQVKKQISALNTEGEKLVAQANFIRGKIEAIEEIISEGDAECKKSGESL